MFSQASVILSTGGEGRGGGGVWHTPPGQTLSPGHTEAVQLQRRSFCHCRKCPSENFIIYHSQGQKIDAVALTRMHHVNEHNQYQTKALQNHMLFVCSRLSSLVFVDFFFRKNPNYS